MSDEEWRNAVQGSVDTFEDDNLPRLNRVFEMPVAPGEDPTVVLKRLEHRKSEALKALPPGALFSHLTSLWTGSDIIVTLYAIKLP